jgi:hypothetical protein
MARENDIQDLERAAAAFVACIDSVPEALFLNKYTEWAPRDVVAHLIGWNRYTIKGCEQIRNGITPFYFDDAGADFSNVNAASVQTYASQDRRELIDELERSLHELQTYLAGIAQEDWERDFGIRYEGHSATVANTVAALTADYRGHAGEIEAWTWPA